MAEKQRTEHLLYFGTVLLNCLCTLQCTELMHEDMLCEYYRQYKHIHIVSLFPPSVYSFLFFLLLRIPAVNHSVFMPFTVNTTPCFSSSGEKDWAKWKHFTSFCHFLISVRPGSQPKATWLNSSNKVKTWKTQKAGGACTYSASLKCMHKHFTSQPCTLRTAAESSSLKQIHFLLLLTLTTQSYVNGYREGQIITEYSKISATY